MKYNKLTQELLAAGYTADNHPDYVTINGRWWNKENPLDNFDGGFTYVRWYIYDKTFRTPCGLQCKGSSCHSSLSYMGIEWTYENDLALTDCPYDKTDCKLKHEYLQGRGTVRYNCNVHLVDEEYQYEGSVEGLKKLRDDEIQREKISFNLQRKGRTCDRQMWYDRDNKQWRFNYDPGYCGKSKCIGQVVNKLEEGERICPILGRPLEKKKGNVFYDIKESGRRYDLDGTLFEGERFVRIIKGNRVFEHPVSMDICRAYAKLCKDDIRHKVRWNSTYSQLIFFAEYFGRDYHIEIFNIRAEQRESRDLMQDLQDIQNGILIEHASDVEKSEKAAKKERCKKSKDKRIQKIERKILEVGYENLERVDQNRACKLLSFERLEELEDMRNEKPQSEVEEPVQMSLFDLGI